MAVHPRTSALAVLCQTARDLLASPLSFARITSGQTRLPVTTSGPESETASMDGNLTITKTLDASIPRLEFTNSNQQRYSRQAGSDQRSLGRNIHVGGIDWIIAGIGVRLWLDAQDQVELSSRDPAHLRSMHIDALRYMNLALPVDLSEAEVEIIKATLPPIVLSSGNETRQVVVATRRNLLREGIAHAVCWVVALIMVIIPLAVRIVNRLLDYEREHRVAQRLFHDSADLAKGIGLYGLAAGDGLVKCKDSLLGKICLDMAFWVVEGIAGGFNDGLRMSVGDRPIVLK